MKKLLLVIFVPVLLAACGNSEPTETAVNEKPIVPAVPAVSKNSPAFNESFQKLLSSYYELKDAMVEFDTVKANAAARQLAANADALKTGEALGSDSTHKTAQDYAGTVNGSALGFAGETDFAQKKKEFKMISNAMYELVKATKYDQQKIYHQHCPMAINDNEEAYWLSNNATVVNPYLGKKHPKFRDAMLACGDVADSLDYSK